jgi:hypothetical protein
LLVIGWAILTPVHAQQSVLSTQGRIEAFGINILYETPDIAVWKKDSTVFDESLQRGMISYKHIPIKDNLGRDIEPVVAIVYEKLPSDSIDPILFSANKRAVAGFNVDEVFSPDDFKLKYKNTIGYYGHYNKGVIHNIIVAHMVYKDVGVQVICDSTKDVYDQVKEDMELFVGSLEFE